MVHSPLKIVVIYISVRSGAHPHRARIIVFFYSAGKELSSRIKKPQIKSAAGNLLSPDEDDRIGRTAENLVFIRIKRIKKAAAQDRRSLKVDTETDKSCQSKRRKAISQDMEIDAADKKRCLVISCAFVFLMCVASFLSYFCLAQVHFYHSTHGKRCQSLL